MEILFALILLLLQNIWDFASNNAGTIVLFIFGYIALKDLDRLKSDVSSLRSRITSLEKHENK